MYEKRIIDEQTMIGIFDGLLHFPRFPTRDNRADEENVFGQKDVFWVKFNPHYSTIDHPDGRLFSYISAYDVNIFIQLANEYQDYRIEATKLFPESVGNYKYRVYLPEKEAFKWLLKNE